MKREKSRLANIFTILLLFIVLSCHQVYGQNSDQGKIKAFVSIAPQAFFVNAVGGENVDVEILLAGGQSPETYEPTPKQMVSLAKADAYFRTGVPFEERLLDKITASMPDLNVIDLRQGISLREMESALHNHHGDGHGEDPHIWLDPVLVKIQAQTICEALKRLNPVNADYFDSNLVSFLEVLDSLDGRLNDLLASLKGRPIMVFHPTFGYFADRYGLKQIAIEVEGKEPGARYLAGLVELARKEKVQIVFIQPQFQSGSAEAVARAIDGRIVVVDPLAHDYIGNLLKFAEILAADSNE